MACPECMLLDRCFLPGWIAKDYIESLTRTQENFGKRYWEMQGMKAVQRFGCVVCRLDLWI